MNGVLVLDKPKGITSRSALNRVNTLLRVKRAGHTGTLDPFATGVLPICINKATKIIPFLKNTFKRYDALIRLGVLTDTLDSTGRLLRERKVKHHIDNNTILGVLSNYEGEIEQVPPMFSAVKKRGVRLYKLARMGIEVIRPARSVFINRIELLGFDPPFVRIMVECSRGTYIRALALDIAEDLGCGGHLSELRRIQSDGFTIDDAVTMEDVEKRRVELADLGEVLSHIKEVKISAEVASRVRDGKQIKKSDLNSLSLPYFQSGDRLKVCERSALVSIAEAKVNSSDFDDLDEETIVLRLLRVIN